VLLVDIVVGVNQQAATTLQLHELHWHGLGDLRELRDVLVLFLTVAIHLVATDLDKIAAKSDKIGGIF
jgi:hypothetical protein